MDARTRPALLDPSRPQPTRAAAAPQAEPVAAHGSLEAELRRVEQRMARLAEGEQEERLGGMVREHLGAGGKRLRARLALTAGEALGAPAAAAVAWAAACELLHNATLIHDDLQDGDRVRRGRPTLWVRHGVAQAINAGDLLLMLPALALDEPAIEPALRWELARLLAAHAAATVRGQAAEQALAPLGETSRTAYLQAVVGKTGALFRLPVEGVALLAGCDAARAASVAEPFCRIGVLYQLQDDLLDLVGEEGGGEPGADLREGKISALVVEHLARHPEDRAWLLALLAAPRERTDAGAVGEALRRFHAGGARDAVLRLIDQERAALQAHPALQTEPELGRLAQRLVERLLAPLARLTPQRSEA